MKKYLLLLAGLMILAPNGPADAKAVKLGRGNAYSVAADANLNTGMNDTQLRKGECESNEECPSDKKCMGYKCVDVCTQPTPKPGMTMARICGGSKCIADPNTPHAFKCVDSCYNVVCKSGYTTEVTSDGCCCVATSCPSGQRLENGKCVANCTGVTCKSGYKAVSNSTGCCCEEDTPTCSGAQVYHPTLKKCVAAVCPANCADMCSKGYCTSCKSGYTLGSDGMCKSTGIINTCSLGCQTCNTLTGKCTVCQSGYTLQTDGTCFKQLVVDTGCPNGLLNCGDTGCCPTGNSCAYYAQQAAANKFMCFKTAYDHVLAE